MKTFGNALCGLITAIVIILAFAALYVFLFYDAKTTTKKDCAVVFGAAVWGYDTPSDALRDRTLAAAELYKDNLVECIILSGGPSTFGAHEVAVMQALLLESDIGQEVTELDRAGTNTKETINNLSTDRTYTFVSNDFHLARINVLAKQAGHINFGLHEATYQDGRYSREYSFFIREVGATLFYVLQLDYLFPRGQQEAREHLL